LPSGVIIQRVKMLFAFLLRIANSAKATVATFLLLVLASAVIYSVIEDKSVGDSVWWAVVTATTVGYGDTYPTHTGGRVLAGVLISSMVLLVVPLITAHFASKLIVDHDAFRHEEQEEIKNNLRFIRAHLEQLSARDSSGSPEAPSDRSDSR
jgi:voltage-gated potassium channel